MPNRTPYKYTQDPAAIDITGGLRSDRYAGVITNMGYSKPEVQFWRDVVGFGSPTINPGLTNEGLAVGPTGDEMFEFPVDTRQAALKQGDYTELADITDPDVRGVEDPVKRQALLEALELSKKTTRTYEKSPYLKGLAGATGSYGYTNSIGDAGEINLALGETGDRYHIDRFSNASAHEEGHMMSNLFKDRYQYGTYDRMGNPYHKYGVRGKDDTNENYNARGYELVAQLGGNRNLYTKEMIDEVNPFIGFQDGEFNSFPADEMLKRVEKSGIKGKYSKEQTADYMKQLNAKVKELNAKAAKDPEWKLKY